MSSKQNQIEALKNNNNIFNDARTRLWSISLEYERRASCTDSSKNLNFLVFPLSNIKAPPQSLRMCNNNKNYLSYAQQQHHIYNVIIGYEVLLPIYLRIANTFLVHTQIYTYIYTCSITSHNLISLRALIILIPLDDLFE